MASHVPFLAVRPDDQFSSDIKPSTPVVINAIEPTAPMDSPPPLTRAPRPPRAVSRIPASLRFVLVALISLSLSTLFRTLTADLSGFQFAPASKDPTHDWQLVAGLLGWKVVALAVAWSAGYDYEDLAALTLLTNQPYYYLLYSFWSVELVPVVTSLIIDIAIIAVPFAFLRPLTHLHDPHTAKTTNQALAQDWQIMSLTAVLAASVYAVTFYLSYYFDLGVFLISHFADIPSLESAHDAAIPKMMALFAGSGIGAMLFLFRPTIAVAGKPALKDSRARSRKGKKFHPETATLAETFAHNLGFGESTWSHRAEVLAKRTLVLVLSTLANTLVRVLGTVEGTDVVGSLGYAGLWAFAHLAVGVAYGLLGNEQ